MSERKGLMSDARKKPTPRRSTFLPFGCDLAVAPPFGGYSRQRGRIGGGCQPTVRASLRFVNVKRGRRSPALVARCRLSAELEARSWRTGDVVMVATFCGGDMTEPTRRYSSHSWNRRSCRRETGTGVVSTRRWTTSCTVTAPTCEPRPSSRRASAAELARSEVRTVHLRTETRSTFSSSGAIFVPPSPECLRAGRYPQSRPPPRMCRLTRRCGRQSAGVVPGE